jgi:hypothetical protein
MQPPLANWGDDMEQLTCLLIVLLAEPGSALDKKSPLAALPSPPGPHVAQIKALKAGDWLMLGPPAPDPQWGPAPGRAYTNKMAYAPDLVGGFLFGEGVHGKHGEGKRAGHYNDDVFLYDLMAHRYICLYPGTRSADFEIRLDRHGFVADVDGQNPPIAIAVHGYECSCYVPETHEFITLLTGSPYSRKIQERLQSLVKDVSLHGRKEGGRHPFFYDTATGRWFRRKVAGKGPVTGFAHALVYIPTHKKTYLYQRGGGFWVYDNQKPSWNYLAAQGNSPTTVSGKPSNEGTLCYDSKRDRLYIFNRDQLSIPWTYDCKTNMLMDLEAKNQPYPASNSYEQGKLMLGSTSSNVHYDSVADVVVMRVRIKKGTGDPRNINGTSLGLAIFDAVKNEWHREFVPLPADLDLGGAWNSFYAPELNVHVFHISGDSRSNGRVLLYRHAVRRARR